MQAWSDFIRPAGRLIGRLGVLTADCIPQVVGAVPGMDRSSSETHPSKRIHWSRLLG